MLQTQVAWWTLQENKRHNVITEEQTNRDLSRREKELINTINFNAKQVEYWQNQLAELSRHNRVTEKLSAKELKIKKQQAKAALQQAKAALSQAGAAWENARVNAYNAATQRSEADSRNVLRSSQTASTKQDVGLKHAQKENVLKQNRYYTTERILIPGANAAANVAKAVGVLIP